MHHKALNISMTCTVIYSIVSRRMIPSLDSTVSLHSDLSAILVRCYTKRRCVCICANCAVYVKDQMSSAGNPSAEFAGGTWRVEPPVKPRVYRAPSRRHRGFGLTPRTYCTRTDSVSQSCNSSEARREATAAGHGRPLLCAWPPYRFAIEVTSPRLEQISGGTLTAL